MRRRAEPALLDEVRQLRGRFAAADAQFVRDKAAYDSVATPLQAEGERLARAVAEAAADAARLQAERADVVSRADAAAELLARAAADAAIEESGGGGGGRALRRGGAPPTQRELLSERLAQHEALLGVLTRQQLQHDAQAARDAAHRAAHEAVLGVLRAKLAAEEEEAAAAAAAGGDESAAPPTRAAPASARVGGADVLTLWST
jgi:hypothetical protein